jgi:hypothetical protein
MAQVDELLMAQRMARSQLRSVNDDRSKNIRQVGWNNQPIPNTSLDRIYGFLDADTQRFIPFTYDTTQQYIDKRFRESISTVYPPDHPFNPRMTYTGITQEPEPLPQYREQRRREQTPPSKS